MANKPRDFPVFTQLDRSAIEQMSAKIVRYLGNLSAILGVDTTEVIKSDDVLIEIIERVEKRRIYFHVFYNGCEMGELNEGALLCFWIVKLHPFYHPKINSNTLNAKIAICLYTNAIYYHSDKTKVEKRIPEQFINDLYYSLLYRDISKESLMILAESFFDKTDAH
jgi:hypothetical protein